MTTPLFLPCIVGPTGAGKTAAALALAEALPLSVVNADSRQVYADFPLITAQPSAIERALCPHVLYGFLATEEKLGAGEYARLAGETLREIAAWNRVPVLVGGTGLYFRALLEGLAPIPEIPPEIAAAWQERCRKEGSQALHALLTERDPAYAAKIHPHDRQRITRALEVHEATGKAFSWWHDRASPQSPYRSCKVGIGLELAELTPVLAWRIDTMLERGALEEARAALERCPDAHTPGWSGIGCAEVYGYLTGQLTLEECRALWFKNTRAYAKRQLTWFRADKDIRWFRPERTREIVEYVKRESGL
ncbi:MAG: tRNA (adenosine(37)-N6)-dimethylallyltransferase MiaA [Desulfovibrionaceae bacterium]|nr:tRNA (adenosine(37)-N6)-dimethylallyltransferase MiaA [Desulfovibrionaceae bacterium]